MGRKKKISFRGIKIPQFEAEVLQELENQLSKQFNLVNKIGWDTKMGFTVENNRIMGIGLHQCGISTLPESIGTLISLTYLNLGDNKLTTLPESIGNLKSLETLRISNNQLTTLPESIGALSSLKELYLEENRLSILPESIRKLSSLKQLWVINNQLRTLPKAIKILEKRGVIIFRDGRIPQVDIRVS